MKKVNIKQDIQFAFHILTHPFDGFWDMKRNKQGKMYIALICVGLYILTNIIKAQLTGFLFNERKFEIVDVMFEIQKVGIIYILFILGNWSITTLMDGEGSMKDIAMTFGYACLPISLIQIPVAIVSNFATYGEGVYISVLNAFSFLWFLFLLFFGIMTIHQYSLSKMVVTTVITIVAILAIIFVYLLFFSLIAQMSQFIAAIYKELSFRWG